MILHIVRTGCLFGLLLSMAGCGATVQHTVRFDPSEPLRVAVVPVLHIGADPEVAPPTDNLLIDEVALLSSKQVEAPAVFIRKLVQNNLRKTHLDLVNPALVELELPHHGYGTADGHFAIEKIHQASPPDLCTHLLSCDAVLYPVLHRWERNYYGIESVASVELGLVIKHLDGSVLFSARVDDSERRGITGIPTGFSDLVVEPLRGLDSEIIEDLARDVVREALKPLLIDTLRPDFLVQPPPAIYAVGHSASDGEIKSAGLSVVLYGSPNGIASFSVGEAIRNIPLIEQRSGRYSGKYFPLPGEQFDSQVITVTLRDRAGRASSRPIAGRPVTLVRNP